MKLKQTFSALLCLAIVAIFLFAGCAKKRPDETPQEFKARKVPVYVAQSYTGLLGLTDYAEAWKRNGELSPEAARTIYQLDEDARKALDSLADYLKAPKDAQTTQRKITDVVLVIQSLRDKNVIRFKSEQKRALFDGIISNGLLLLQHIQFEAIGGQQPKNLSGAITDTILITADLQARLQRQAGMSAEEARAEAKLLSGEIESKNAARLAN